MTIRLPWRTCKRTFVDALGNYLFFVPFVIGFTPALQNWDGIQDYLIAAIPLSIVGARAYTLFLKYFWYRIWRESF